MSGIGGFATGLMQGIEARDRMDLNREYKRALAARADIANRDWQNYLDLTRENYQAEHGSLEGYVAPERTRLQDPALLRFGKWLGKKIGWGQQGNTEEQGAVQQMAIPEQTVKPQPFRSFRDGGKVERTLSAEEKQRRRAAGEDAGGIGAFMEDLGRSAADYFDDTRAVAGEAYKEEQAKFDRLRQADSAQEAGARFTDWLGSSARASLGTGAALAKDVFLDNPVTQFVGGALGFGSGPERAANDSEPAVGNSEQAASPIPPQNVAPSRQMAQLDKTTAIDAAVSLPERSDEEIAQTAVQEGEIAALENLDYKLLVDRNVSPEELPSMTTQDWSAYRHAIFKYEIGRGASIQEAAQAVDALTVDIQMRGFQREGQKALLYLQTGQAREAAMALRQAYQYFPNGVSVRFGMANDPATGQPAIIAMGMDEQTGEPSGSPMLITGERLGAMMENLSNPSAFRAWTKDGRDLQMQINQLQSLDDYRQRSLDLAQAGAITDRIEAVADATNVSGQGGMRFSDVDRRSQAYRQWAQDQERIGDFEEGVAAALADAMDRVTRLRPDIPPNTVIKAVQDAWNQGGELEVLELLESLRKK